MNAAETLKKRKILVIAFLAYMLAFLFDPEIFRSATVIFVGYLIEMIEILPAIFIITGLIDVWVSRETILKHFGVGSGKKGRLLALMIGSVSAGPIYAAFPVTKSLLKKGASVSNIVIILSAWAVVKVPMLVVEAKFLGLGFMGVRYVLTVPCIIAMGIILERMVNTEEVIRGGCEDNSLETRILDVLPGYNCGSCGHKNCSAFAKAVTESRSGADSCKPGGKSVEEELAVLLK